MTGTCIRLVVVDDHALFRRGLIGLLADMPDFEVVGEAGNGKEGLDVIERTKPDIVLLDVNMPVMSGWDLINKLKEADIHTKMSVIMVTSSFDPEDRKKADSYDCIIDYIEKPLDIDLCNRIKRNEAISRFFS